MLKGTRVTLRDPELTDLPYFFKWHNDTEIKKQAMLYPYFVEESRVKTWLENIGSRKSTLYFTIETIKDNKPVGYTLFRDISEIHKNCMFGIIIGENEQRGKGLGNETLHLMLEYGFNALNMYKIKLEVLESNTRAVQLYKNAGFVQEGILKDEFFHQKTYHNVIQMALFRK
ncbi:MAG: GNAT family N-acetyltransferase [Bacteroidales bacterium]|nr:GNAT family N-acetyltransferase [Bacteroidales bacterium]